MRTLLTALLIGLTALHAELSPDHYRRLQDEAAEALVVKIAQVDVKVTLGKDGKQFDVRATATVQSVLRSKAGHRPGDVIPIAYTVIQTVVPMPGPSQPKILAKDETVRAYLKPGDGAKTLGPAAYGQSFLTP